MKRPHTTAAIGQYAGKAGALPQGLTLVELLCTLAILMVMMGGALPMLQDLLARQSLRAQAAVLETDIHLARAQAQLYSQSIRLSLQTLDQGGTCYIVHTGPLNACRCTGGGQSVCEHGATALRVVEQAGLTGITLAAASRNLTFDAGKGTVTPTATLRLTDRDGRAVHQVVNLMGRVRTCSPADGFASICRC